MLGRFVSRVPSALCSCSGALGSCKARVWAAGGSQIPHGLGVGPAAHSHTSTPEERDAADVPYSTVNVDRDPQYKGSFKTHSDDRDEAPYTGLTNTPGYEELGIKPSETSMHTINNEGISSGPGRDPAGVAGPGHHTSGVSFSHNPEALGPNPTSHRDQGAPTAGLQGMPADADTQNVRPGPEGQVMHPGLDEAAAKLKGLSQQELWEKAQKEPGSDPKVAYGNLRQQQLVKEEADKSGRNLVDQAQSAL